MQNWRTPLPAIQPEVSTAVVAMKIAEQEGEGPQINFDGDLSVIAASMDLPEGAYAPGRPHEIKQRDVNANYS